MSNTTMYYGGNLLRPVPMVSISKQYQKTSNGVAVGMIYDVSLQGYIVETGSIGGLDRIISGQRYLRETFNRDGKYFQLKCGDNTLLEGYPVIASDIQFNNSPDNWTFSCPYSLTLQFNVEPVDININGSGENTNLFPPFISDYDDNWSFEFDDSVSNYVLPVSGGTDVNSFTIRATHEVTAQGKSHYDGAGLTGSRPKEAWQYAKDLVVSKLNINPSTVMASGVFNLPGSWTAYNHLRVDKLNESAGTFGVSETFILASGSRNVIEEFQAEIRTSTVDPFVSVNINGSVQGLEARTYGTNSGEFSITSTKYANASGYFETIRDNLMIYPRVLALGAAEGVSLNSTPLNKVITKSPPRGLITYSYEYNNRPSNCITGAKTESIIISDENPNDVFARLLLLGRPQGPILQSFNTITDFRRTVSIDAQMSPPTGCSISILTGSNNPHGQVSSILCMFENDLRTRYNKVYKERDSNTWDPKNGRYNRSVSWAAVDCTNVPPISLCSGA